MSDGIYTALAGARAQTNALDVAANNIANANTTGYRAQKVAFGEVLAAAQAPDMAYSKVADTGVDTSQGTMRQTDNPLDLALMGDGYFTVQTPQGERYTRAGDFRLNDAGELVDGSGHQVLSQAGTPIAIPDTATNIQVDEKGAIRADDIEVGQLKLAVFDPGQMRREGNSLFAANGAPDDQAEAPTVVSGSLEGSNVNVVRGMVGLVKVSRTYEALMRMIESYKQVDARTARDIGTPK